MSGEADVDCGRLGPVPRVNGSPHHQRLFLIPDVGDALDEKEWQDAALRIAPIDRGTAQGICSFSLRAQENAAAVTNNNSQWPGYKLKII
jgi:hypothetical protein